MINTQSYSLDDAEKGLLISFPSPTHLKVKNQYILYFDSPVTLPENAGTVVEFEPNNGSYTIVASSSFVPKVLVKIKSLYRLQTKTLIRLIIKDTSNNIIYTDYIMLVCSPESVYNIVGKILVLSAVQVGINGGSIFQITRSNQSTSSLRVGDKIEGPFIPSSDNVYVKSIITNNSFELSQAINVPAEQEREYKLTRRIGCVDPSTISDNVSHTAYTILDITNNWTYRVRNQIIAKFICDDPLNNQDLTILLPIKNTTLLAQEDNPSPIPFISQIKAGGRVINDTVPISEV